LTFVAATAVREPEITVHAAFRRRRYDMVPEAQAAATRLAALDRGRLNGSLTLSIIGAILRAGA
jgi:hypothetical protein